MTDAQGIAGARLLSFIERIERLEAEKAEIASDIKEVKSEAKSAGFDLKIINLMLKRRKMEAEALAEQEMLLDTYENAIGQLKGTPLDNAARERNGLTPAEESLKKKVDNLTKEPGSSISVTAGGVTTKLSNVDGKRVLEQTGEPPKDMGPPPREPEPDEEDESPPIAAHPTAKTVPESIAAIKRGELGAAAE